MRRSTSKRLVLRREGKSIKLTRGYSARGLRDKDSRLIYTRLPDDLETGSYQMYYHNGFGGRYGWRHVASLRVQENDTPPETMFDVTEFGADGSDSTSDREAIQKAMAKAKKTKRGVVFFPPGVFYLDQTLEVPEGVTLRGADRQTSVVKGMGYEMKPERGSTWWSTDPKAASLLMLNSHTGLEGLTVTGAVAEGMGGTAMIQGQPDDDNRLANVRIHDCDLRGTAMHPTSDAKVYRKGRVFQVWPQVHRLKFTDNVTRGGMEFHQVYRSTFRDNLIKTGGIKARAYDSLMAGNIFKEAPFRILFYPVRHTYIRYNEMHNYFRDSWNNAPETFLTHGGDSKQIGNPTGAGRTTLTDADRQWESGKHTDHYVLISAGRGFGQYRRVVDNSEDTLELAEPWRVKPDSDSEYALGRYYVENAYYANMSNSPGSLNLSHDCISMIIDRHRTEEGIITIWGRDRARKKDDGSVKRSRQYLPSWYNMVVDSWLDGSHLHLKNQEYTSSPNRGPAMFGTYLVKNRISEPHRARRPHNIGGRSRFRAGISITGFSRYTVVAKNFLSYTHNGIAISGNARRTFILHNEFQQVDRPVVDRGYRTHLNGNVHFEYNKEKGEHRTELSDENNTRDREYRRPHPPTDSEKADDSSESESDASSAGPSWNKGWLKRMLGTVTFSLEKVNSDRAKKKCQKHLRLLYQLVKSYEDRHGQLPNAAFYGRHPRAKRPGIGRVLGERADSYMQCPAGSPELLAAGFPSYIWNKTLNGRSLSEIKDPGRTWMLMDLVGIHEFLFNRHHGGHQGGVNVLFADGTVRWIESFNWDKWAARGHRVAEQ